MQSLKKFHIICLGDSLTYGWCFGNTFQFPYSDHIKPKLEKKFSNIKFVVYNESVPGSCIDSMQQRYEKLLKNLHEYGSDDVIITNILAGGNDLGQFSFQQTIERLISLISSCLTHDNSYVTLISNTGSMKMDFRHPFSKMIDKYNDVLKKMANDCKNKPILEGSPLPNNCFNKLYYIELSKKMPHHRRYFDSDGVHYTDEGYRRMGDIIYESLVLIIDSIS